MVELADIFRCAGPEYLARFGSNMLDSHRRVLKDVVDCRTAAFGGQLYDCGNLHPVYHSCRNRHCPKCQGAEGQRWYEARSDVLLPTEYGLATVTLPADLRDFGRSNQRVVYSILIREAAYALQDVAAESRFLGGLTGIMALLHTWTRALIYHPHVHMIFPWGALSSDGEKWVKPRKRGFIPSYALAKKFRVRVEAAFKKADLYDLVPARVWRKRWVANIKKVGSGHQAVLYLSRYVFRNAISNDRIEAFDGESVTFRWTDSGTGKTRRETLQTFEFIRRVLQHALPRRFVRIRYYGLWASACRKKLAVARDILVDHLNDIGKPPPPPPDRDAEKKKTQVAAYLRCPMCGKVFTKPPREIPGPRGPP